MPVNKTAEKKAAITMLEQCPAEKLKTWIMFHVKQSNAVMIGATRSGKALVITEFTEAGRDKQYPEELEELYKVLETQAPF